MVPSVSIFLHFLLVATSFSTVTATSCTDLQNLSFLQRDVRLPAFKIVSMTTDGVMTCARNCLTRKWCKSFNFNTSSGMCELNYKRLSPGGLNVTSLVSAPDYVFSDVTQWPQKLAGVCANHTCSINKYCNPINNNNYTCIVYVKPTSCAEVKECDPTSIDGEYWIRLVNFDLYRTRIYCYNMSTTDPKEYLTLPNPNYGVYPTVSNPSCTNEVQLQGTCTGKGGEVWYHKISVNITDMQVRRHDKVFANYTNFEIPYAQAHACYSKHNEGLLSPCGTKGRFTVDLSGTGWTVPPEKSWVAGGYLAIVESVIRNAEGTIIQLKCGGYGGWCYPEGFLRLMPHPADKPKDPATEVFCSL